MKKSYLTILWIFILVSCQFNTKNELTSGDEIKPKEGVIVSKDAGTLSSQKVKIDKFLAEMGINELVRNKNFTDSSRINLDSKAKAFMEKYKNDNSNEKRTAIDRVSRLVLFDFGLLNSGKLEDKSQRDFYALVFLKNGGSEPLHLFEILKYVKKEKLVKEDEIKRITWYLEQNLNSVKEVYSKSLEDHSLKIEKDPKLRALYLPDDEIMTARMKTFETIAKEIERWPKIPSNSIEEYWANWL